MTFRDIAWNIDGVIVIHKTYPPTAVTYNTTYSDYREEENDSMSFAKYAKQNDGIISIHEYYANAEEALIAAADAFREAICSEIGEPDIDDIRTFLRYSFLGATNCTVGVSRVMTNLTHVSEMSNTRIGIRIPYPMTFGKL